MERKTSIYLYVLAFILAAILFSIGIYVGTIINQNAMNSLENKIDEINEKVANIGILLFLEENNRNFCSFYKEELRSLDSEREKLGYEISLMEEQRGFSSPETKRKYMILQTQSLFFSKKMQALCGEDYSFVLFFYNNNNCSICRSQGDAILKARDSSQKKEKIKIYAFDSGLDSAVVNALMREYNINSIPTTIIGNASYAGLVSVQDLKIAMDST